MLSQKPMSFSEILEALGVSSSFLTYHIENLGELVSKTDNGKYRLSSFGEAAIATMTKVEDIPRTVPSQNENFTKFAPKFSIATRIITHIYILALVVSVVLASLYFLNYTNSSGPLTSTICAQTLLVHPDQNFSFYIAIDHRPLASYLSPNDSHLFVWAWRFDENHTYWFDGPPIRNTLTHWQIEGVHFSMNPSVDIKFSRALVWSETGETVMNPEYYYGILTARSFSGALDITEVTQPSLYEFVITNLDSLKDMNDTMQIQLVKQYFDKPYFYYGVAGLLIGFLYPAIILAPRLVGKRHMSELTATTH
jgi:hypothetical protein